MKRSLLAFGAGLVFALGLGLGGMTSPQKIIDFLDFTGSWDPSLLFFMGSALLTYAIIYRLVRRRTAPILAPKFGTLPAERVDRRLLGGAVVFGVGWGLTGFCPAPAVTSAVTGTPHALLFCVTMLAGMVSHDLLAHRRRSSESGLPVAATTNEIAEASAGCG